jgi:hypothetical protein
MPRNPRTAVQQRLPPSEAAEKAEPEHPIPGSSTSAALEHIDNCARCRLSFPPLLLRQLRYLAATAIDDDRYREALGAAAGPSSGRGKAGESVGRRDGSMT